MHSFDKAKLYEEALKNIKECGQVCSEFELCTHKACKASYTAWAIADEALLRASRVHLDDGKHE